MNKPNQWSEELLEASRLRTDPFADAFVADLAKTKTAHELYGIMRVLLDEYVWFGHEKLDNESHQFLDKASKLPSWADPELIKKGEAFFCLHGPEIGMVLLMKSLPATYCCWKGAEVVHATGRMTDHSGNLKPFTRRLMETSKFILNVCSIDGLSENGKGVQSAVKVRTLHAFVRNFLHDKKWDTEKYQEPINQEDYCGTMLSFSVFVIEGLERFGIRISEEEKNAYLHLWRVVGHLVGVEDQLLPKNYKEGHELGHAILNHQKGASDSGKELTQACVDFMEGLMPLKAMKFLPENMMFYLLGPELSQMIGIKKSKSLFIQFLVFIFIKCVHLTEWLKHHIPFIKRWAIRNNPKIMDKIIQQFIKQSGLAFTPKILAEEVEVIKKAAN